MPQPATTPEPLPDPVSVPDDEPLPPLPDAVERLALELAGLTKGHTLTMREWPFAQTKAAIIAGRLAGFSGADVGLIRKLPKPARRLVRKELARLGRHDLASIR